ncbi:hypothetical protein ACLOJK_011798 [Asimina triloba]
MCIQSEQVTWWKVVRVLESGRGAAKIVKKANKGRKEEVVTSGYIECNFSISLVSVCLCFPRFSDFSSHSEIPASENNRVLALVQI